MTATHLGTDQHAVPPGPLWTAAPAGAVSVIFHLAAHEDWERASSAGRYTTASLHDDGFIGCSTATQHAAVANARFAGRTDLVLLLIDPDRLASPIRIEPPDTAGAAFPHVDGPVDLDAVFEATLYQPGPDGRFHPHEEASGFAAHGAATLAETKRRAVEAMAGFAHLWWVAGGWALDLFLGRKTRPHADLEIGTTTSDGVAFVRPEIALLFKAKATRFKDHRDFDRVLPHLDGTARAWLRSALAEAHPGHAWRERL
jgi:uncharacterized protein (DUF952 family)